MNVIKQFFNWMVENGQRADNPVTHLKIRGTKRQKLYQVFTPQELDKIYMSYEVPLNTDERKNKNWFKVFRLTRLRNKAILSLLINQGLTTVEIAQLTLRDLNMKEGRQANYSWREKEQ